MKDEANGLNVRELLKETYSRLSSKNNPREIILPNYAFAEIADDSDWHRIRVGSMRYNTVRLFNFNKKCWAISRGERCGSYPAERYDSDLLALEFILGEKTPEQIQEELNEKIEGSSYFRNSLIFGMADGNLALTLDGRFTQEMYEKLGPELQRFILQEPEYNTEVILASTLQHPTTKNMLYKPEFADFLACSIEEILSK